MTKNVDNNHEELSQSEIFEKIKQEIAPLQESLSKKSITVQEVKKQLERINEWIKWTNLEKEKQQKLWSVFNKLNQELQETTNENQSIIWIEWLINKINEIEQDREEETEFSINSSKEEQTNLAHEIIEDYYTDAQKWRIESDKNIKDQFARAVETETGRRKRLAEAINHLLNS